MLFNRNKDIKKLNWIFPHRDIVAMKTNEGLDKTLKDFFQQQENWKSSCFSKSKELEKIRRL